MCMESVRRIVRRYTVNNSNFIRIHLPKKLVKEIVDKFDEFLVEVKPVSKTDESIEFNLVVKGLQKQD